MNSNILRKKYPLFIYEGFKYSFKKNNLNIEFVFKIVPDIEFHPKITIENMDQKRVKKIENKVLRNLIFNLGMAEIFSYWKCTASPEIRIKAGFLNQDQIKWWTDLLLNGMGQFFYENNIDFKKRNFVSITSSGRFIEKKDISIKNKKILVPVGGGKDSVVTLEVLRTIEKEVSCLVLNAQESSKKIVAAAGCKKIIVIRRKIDEKLLELNKEGFLNGHTPFSAYLAFLSVLCAAVLDYKFVALSSERSSNEGNVDYLGEEINHQYSKSFVFEEKFRKYSKRYLLNDIDYFSFLRPLYEIQIAKLFSGYPEYFDKFLSCNESYKKTPGLKKTKNKWCGKCPKCLFVFLILYPFIEENKLLNIFKKNLFEDKKLLPTFERLMGEKGIKPFECVGTKNESIAALYFGLIKAVKSKNIPFILSYFNKEILPKYPEIDRMSGKIMTSWDNQNNIPENLANTLKKLIPANEN